jgi:4-hydroxy-tetrahydrodipicolinate reductase
MIRVVLAGHRGKAGSAVARALAAAPDIDYAAGAGSADDLQAILAEHRTHALVDFTNSASGLRNALAAARAGAAPIVGTSGISSEGVDQLEAACREAGVGGMVAPNFAVGAVVMMWLAEKAAPHFDAVEVIEAHHAAKVDAPSGTALATARRLAAAGTFSYNRPDRVTLEGTRGGEQGGVGVHSIRLPGLVGDQEVIFGLPGQTLAITHRTTSRDAYGPGVLLAVRHVTQKGGFYRGLEQLLGLN